ncbi:hypothetical protein [Nonomuraea sp. NPDC003804]
MTEPLPPQPYGDAALTEDDGPQRISQDPAAVYVSEIEEDDDDLDS